MNSLFEKQVGRDVKSSDTEQESTLIQPTLKGIADPKMTMTMTLFTHSQTFMIFILLYDTKGEIGCRISI